MAKFYAIKNGYNYNTNKPVVNEIVRDWPTCSSMVKGVKNAQYKSFKTLEEANIYLGIGEKKEDENFSGLRAYVDGSFNITSEKFSYGVVIIKEGIVIHAESGVSEDDSQKNLRQIAGELKGAERALEYACNNSEKSLKIYHDYMGVRNHATGEWQRKEISSQKYYEKMNRLKNENGIDLSFAKVDSHTGDMFNEVADELAKSAGEIRMSFESDKIIRKSRIKVKNQEVKNALQVILRAGTEENVEIVE